MWKGLGLIYILCAAIAIRRDLIKYEKYQTTVVVRMWTCSKTTPQHFMKSKTWNNTLHNLPNVSVRPYVGNKPIENLFTLSPTVRVPFSPEARDLLDTKWDEDDAMCFWVDPYPMMCNLFLYCWWWPLIVPLKPIWGILDPIL